MTFGEYKANGGTWHHKIFANDAGCFGHKGSIIYGYTPSMEDWDIAEVEEWVDFRGEAQRTLHLIYPH